MNQAKFVKQITVIDPDSKGEVQLSVYKHENGGMFAIDSSFLDQCFDDDCDPLIPDPFFTKEDGQDNDVVVLLENENAFTKYVNGQDLPQE